MLGVLIKFNRPQCLKQCLKIFFPGDGTEVWHRTANESVATMPVNQSFKTMFQLSFYYPAGI